jgi:cellulose synthase operon protein C
MRLAIVATPALLPDQRPAPGSLDGDLIRARLSLADMGFRVVDVDPARDLAEQLDVLFDEVAALSRQTLLEIDVRETGPALFLFYASSAVALAADGELFLCLDPANPGVGDALSDIAAVFRDRARGAVLFVVECHHAPGALSSESVVAAARQAVASHLTGIELLVAAHPLGSGTSDAPSPFTRAFVEQLDDADPERETTTGTLFRRVQENEASAREIPSFARVRGQVPFPLFAGRSGVVEASTPPPPLTPSAPPAAAPSTPPAAPPEEPPRAASSNVVHDSPGAVPPSRVEPERESAEIPVDAVGLSNEARSRRDGGLARVTDGVERASEVPVAQAIDAGLAGRALSYSASEATASADEGGIPTTPASSPDDPVAQYLAAGDALAAAWDIDGALTAYKKALALSQREARAEIYLRIAYARWRQDKRREAISSFEKALQLAPEHRPALEALIELNVAERDFRALRTAEERLLSRLESDDDRFAHLAQFAERWEALAEDEGRARELLERARELRQDDVGVLCSLQRLYEAAGLREEAFDVRQRRAELTTNPREQAQAFLSLARIAMQGEPRATMSEIHREHLGLELLDRALDADPTLLEPLALMAVVLAARQEWSELELAYRRMLARARHIPDERVRSDVTWELNRRLGLLFRDHLEDPRSALDAFEGALAERPDDLQGRLTVVALARRAGRPERAAVHLQAAAVLDPGNTQVFHELFEVFQKLRRPDQAWAAACATVYLDAADQRERFIFEENRPDGIIRPVRALSPESWELLRAGDRDRALEAVLASISDAAIRARLAQRASEKRLAQLDPSARQDPRQSTVSAVRSFDWASRCLGIKAPALYLREDASLALAAVMVEEPSVIVGSGALRGRTFAELAFLVGNHLAYHIGPHRLLLYFPSIEELGACLLAAVALVRPSTLMPAALEDAARALMPLLDERLGKLDRETLARAVTELYEGGAPADLPHWACAVERCAARAGYLLCGDLSTAAAELARAKLTGLLSAEERIGDLISYTVSDAYHALRRELGIAIEP